MTKTEITIVSRYAAAELSGALFLGKFARLTQDPYLRVQLTQHCSEEARHSWMWVKFLSDRQLPLEQIHERDEYFEYLHSLKDEISMLAAVHVYEMRIPFHFSLHMQVSTVDPELKTLIEKIVADEKFHLAWIHNYLEKLQSEGNKEVSEAVKKAGELEDIVYRNYLEKMKQGDPYEQELATLAEQHLSSYPYEWKQFVT